MQKTETRTLVRNLLADWISGDGNRARAKIKKVNEAYKKLRKVGGLPNTLLWTDKQRFLWKMVTSYHHLDAGARCTKRTSMGS